MNENDQFEDEYLGPSKSQVKREMHALQDLGKFICELPKKQLVNVPLSDTMLVAIEEWYRLKKHEAKRRHLQYVGKIMRTEDLEAVQLALDKMNPSSDVYNRVLHQQERWRERLIAEGNEALNEFCAEFEVTEVQHLRQLIRNAIKENKFKEDNPEAQAKSGKSDSRKLFLYIKSFYKD